MESLAVEHVFKKYGNRHVVNGVNLEVKRGEVVGLLGPNGAGKTTTFYMMVGLIQPDSGRVLLNAQDITRQPMFERAKNSIGYLPQEPSVFRKLTVEQNVMAILEFIEPDKKKRKERLEELLEELRITKIAKTLGESLSGGERRRVEIVRSLATKPRFILLDEPFAGVDPIAVNDIQMIISMLKSKNLGVLITDHNVRETLNITDRAYIMNDGKILVSGDRHFISESEVARKIYLGEKFTL
ncbi:MAG: LPS export ABC transporter ATP-binding protein [bacterium]|jgi:lipopolysaccharide export system ATP-binding protein|nr:LPS export ABC transporter ATP-binding protein [bacterium]